MNVLLVEAEVPYDQVFEMAIFKTEFGQAVNPAAQRKGSPI